MKRKVLAIVLAVTMVFSLTACGQSGNGNETPDNAQTEGETEGETTEGDTADEPTETAEPEPVEVDRGENLEPSGQIVVGSSTENSGDCTPWWTNSASDYDVYKLIKGYGTVEMTQEEEYIYNDTAIKNVEETDNEDGSKTFTFTLQPDLKWSNGDPLTANDYVGAALLWVSNEVYIELEAANAAQHVAQYWKGYSAYSSGESDVFEGVHLISEDTFSFTVDAQHLPYYYGKALVSLAPDYMKGWLPEDITIEETENGAKFSDNYTSEYIKESIEAERWQPSATCGPYIMESYDQGSNSYTLKVNPEFKGDYAGKTANIETIIYKYVGQDTMMDELKTGSVDLLLQVADGALIDAGLDMVEAGTHGYLTAPRNGYGQLIYKCNIGPTQFVEVRQAIAYLLDRIEFAKAFTGGHGAVANGPYGLSQWMVEEAEDEVAALNSYSYSLDKATELLVAGGWTLDADGNEYSGTGVRHKDVDGELMPLIIEWCSSENNSVSDLLVTMLGQNEDVAAAGMQINQTVVTFTELLDGYYNDTGNYNMFNMGQGFSVPYDIAAEYEIDGAYNLNRINDEKLASLSDQMNKVAEGDDETYLGLWVEFMQRWNELLPNVPLYSNEYHAFFTNRLKGYTSANEIWEFAFEILYAYVED